MINVDNSIAEQINVFFIIGTNEENLDLLLSFYALDLCVNVDINAFI